MADQNDLTTDVSLYDESGNPVKVFLYPSGNRLAVDATISSDESPTKYSARSHIDTVGQVVGATDVSLFSFTGVGLLDFVATSSGNANYEIALKIDGVEAFRTTMADLGSIGLSNAVNVPIWAETANKNFRFNPQNGSGFTTSVEVLARSTVGTQTIAHMVMYREKT